MVVAVAVAVAVAVTVIAIEIEIETIITTAIGALGQEVEEVEVEGTAASQRGSCIRVFSTMSEARSPDLPGAPGPSQNLRRFQ